MQKIRILLAIDDASLGGGQMHILLLAKYLAKVNFEVEIATEDTGWLVEEAHKLDIVVRQISISNNLTWKSFSDIHQFLQAHKFDVVHTHGGTAGFWMRLGTLELKPKPILIHTYHGLHYLNFSQVSNRAIYQQVKGTVFKYIDRLLLKYTDRVICVCRSDYDKAIAAGVAIVSKTSIVYNGIEVDKFSNPLNSHSESLLQPQALREHQRTNARQRFEIPPTNFVFGTVGRLHEQKGHKFLLQAFAKITNPAQLMIIGDGELRDDLIMLADELKISDRVSFLGARSDIYEFLTAIDVFVLPSLWEGQPIALLEALAADKPCIASAVDGISEIITDGVNGYLVKPKDIDELVSVMNTTIKDPDLLQRFSNCGASAISPKFLAQNMAMAIADIYLAEKVLNNR